MRVGLLYGLGPDALPAGEGFYDLALDQIELADRLGLDCALFEEHRGALGSPGVASLAAAAAARTTSIRVGAAGLVPSLSHPVRVAEDWAIVDLVSRGRAILGASAGGRAEDFRAAGVDWEGRAGRFREALELIRTAWTQGSFQFVGDHYVFPLSATGEPGWRPEPYERPYVDQWRRGQVVPQYLAVTPKPVQLPHPPMWAGVWDRDDVEWAARRGFPILWPSLATDAELRERIGWYRESLDACGRDVRETGVIIAREVFVADSAEKARRAALPSLAERLRAVREDAGAAERPPLEAMTVGDEEKLLDACFVVGGVAEVVDRLKQLQAETGMTHVICRVFLPGRGREEVRYAINLLASQVQTRLVV